MAIGGGLVSVRILGQERVLAGLAAFQRVAKDLRPFWRDVFAPKYFAMVQDVFRLQGQRRGPHGRFAKGGQWAPLSPRYAAWKARRFPNKGILEREGHLRRSLTWDGAALGPGGVFRPRADSVVVGTTIKYASAHQDGYSGGHLPARPFLDPPDPRVFAPLLRTWLLRNAKGRSGGLPLP